MTPVRWLVLSHLSKRMNVLLMTRDQDVGRFVPASFFYGLGTGENYVEVEGY
jgi:hypothetical protein